MRHNLDDNRDLFNEDETPFDENQRYSHFYYLENQHKINRKYPPIEEQLDMIYWDKVNGTNIFAETIESIKQQYPKADVSNISNLKDKFGN